MPKKAMLEKVHSEEIDIRPSKKPRYKLAPWQSRFALFYATEAAHGTIAKDTQVQVAQQFASEGRDPALPPVKMTYDKVRTTKEHPDFIALVDSIRQNGIEATTELARTIFANNLPTLAAYHQWAADMARAKQDYRAMPMFTGPLFKHLLPDTNVSHKAVFNITFSDTRERLLVSERPIIEAEIVPPKELTDGV
jgi:hypothetical protein